MATSIKVTSVDGNENFKTRTYSDANPNASNATLNQFARKIGSISTNTIVNVTRVDLDDITGAVAGPLKTFTWTTNYFAPAKFFKQDFICPETTSVDSAAANTVVTSATLSEGNANFALSTGETATFDATEGALMLTADDTKDVDLTFGDMVTIFNASSPGAKFAEIATSKFAEANYNLVLEYDASTGSIVFKNYAAATVKFAIDSSYPVGNFIGRWLYEEYNDDFPAGIEIVRMANAMVGTVEYFTTIDV